MKIANDTLLDAASVAVANTSEQVDLRNIYMYAIQMVWTGTPSGNIIVEKSVDGATWFTENSQAMGGAAGTAIFEKTAAAYPYMRVRNTSGSVGTVTAKYFAKGS